jgi:thiamine-monophosphate kinase
VGVPNPSPAIPQPAGEDAVVARIRAALSAAVGDPPDQELWIGDDAAVVAPPTGWLVLATDAAVAGVHADLSLVGVDDLGWKAMTAALSDLGAMGAEPRQALVTLCLPAGTDVDALNAGVTAAAAAHRCPVVGGDLSSSSQLMVSVAVVGSVAEDPPPVRRSGASPGEAILVTGPLGRSAAGLRLLRSGRVPRSVPVPGPAAPDAELVAAHRRPVARLAEGKVARRAGASAMMDVSDGLSIDLDRLARASGVGVRLDRVPVAPGATVEEALGGGEDYELLVVTSDPDRLEEALADAGLRRPERIGTCTDRPEERRLQGRPLARRGWEHPLG